jgi:hypothetical protein
VTAVTGGLLWVYVDATWLSDGFTYLDASHASGSFVYIITGLELARKPANLAAVTA